MRYGIYLLLTLLFSGNLFARSNACTSGTGARGYEAGYRLQKNVIRYLWEEKFHSECYELESFISAVNISFDPGNYGGDRYLRCRDEGMVSGLTGAIDEIQDECGHRCVESGSSAGELFAKQYCGVVEQESQAAAEMASQINICETFSTQACKTALLGFVNSKDFCRSRSEQDPAFQDFVDNIACAVR